jgi:phosphate transport system substrate-binding protein
VTYIFGRTLGTRVNPVLRSLAVGIAVASVITAAVQTTAHAQAPVPPRPQQQETVLRLAGSYTFGARAALELATAWARQLKLPGVRIDGGIDADEYDVIAEGAESLQKLTVQVRAKGTPTGLEPLLRGQADLWMASRQVNEADIEAMRRKRIPNVPSVAQFQQPGVENVVGLATMAVLVHPKNPLTSLTVAQIHDLYAGKVTSWAQVGGASNTPIGLYSLEAASGQTEAFCKTIMGITDPQQCVDSFPRLAAPRFPLQDDIADAVAGNPAGIGFGDYSLRRSARALALGTGCGNSIEPTPFRVKAEEYPLARRVYLYTMPGRPVTPATAQFLQLALGPVGQAAIAAAGLADLAPGKSDADYGDARTDTANNALDGGRTRVRAGDARAFANAIAAADRLSITFRFQTGTNYLDSRAEADITRLVALMNQPAYASYAVTLIGFSSASGDYLSNRALSSDRAAAVRDRLLAAGLRDVTALGIGPGAAVACNLDAATAPLNQRVEVWLRKRS